MANDSFYNFRIKCHSQTHLLLRFSLRLMIGLKASRSDRQERPLATFSRAFKKTGVGAGWLNVLLWVLIGQHLKLNESQCFISICACHSPYHGLHARLLVQIVKDKALSCCFLSQSIERITNKKKNAKTNFCLIWWINLMLKHSSAHSSLWLA